MSQLETNDFRSKGQFTLSIEGASKNMANGSSFSPMFCSLYNGPSNWLISRGSSAPPIVEIVWLRSSIDGNHIVLESFAPTAEE
jgi:hypothetical protein